MGSEEGTVPASWGSPRGWGVSVPRWWLSSETCNLEQGLQLLSFSAQDQRDQGWANRKAKYSPSKKGRGGAFRKHCFEPSRYPLSVVWEESCGNVSLARIKIQAFPAGNTLTALIWGGSCSREAGTADSPLEEIRKAHRDLGASSRSPVKPTPLTPRSFPLRPACFSVGHP